MTDLDFMYLLEEAKRPGILHDTGDLLYAYDRPARVYRDPRTMNYIAEVGHEDVINWVGRLVKYKGQVLVVEHVEVTTGKGPGITARPL